MQVAVGVPTPVFNHLHGVAVFLLKFQTDQYITFLNNDTIRGFPGGAAIENPPANARDTGSSPGPGRSHMPRSN